MKYFFLILIAIHGFIHLMGFVKAFGYAQIHQLTKEITKQVGVMWLLAALTLIITGILYISKSEYWWAIALVGVILSQLLIVFHWRDAKFGTIANIVILIIVIPAWTEWRFENQYKKDVAENLSFTVNEPLLKQESISQLPAPVQRYIIHSGAIDKPIPKNFKIKFDGQIRQDEKSAWMPFTTEQYNFIDKPTRLFFMKATMKGLPISGYHSFKNGTAIMDIRLLSLFKVQYQDGRKMDFSETVTWFNDLCLFAPGALIDKRIKWNAIDDLSSKATFTNHDITISATLYFNGKDELINFISDDRYRIVSKEDAQLIRFSTPARDYIKMNEHLIPSYGEAVWSLPDGDLTYGQFLCKDIQYNVKDE